MSIIQLIHAAVLALNRIQSRSVSMIHAFRFASISKQLIYREIDFFFKSNLQNFKSNLKWNHFFGTAEQFCIAADIFIRATLWYWLCVLLIVAVCRSLRVLSQAGIASKRVARHGWFLPRDAMLARYMLWRRVWLWARRSAEIDRCTAGGEQQPQRMRAVPRHQLTHDAERKLA